MVRDIFEVSDMCDPKDTMVVTLSRSYVELRLISDSAYLDLTLDAAKDFASKILKHVELLHGP